MTSYAFYTSFGFLLIAAGFTTIISAIGWGICSSTTYCPDNLYSVIMGRGSQQEYTLCCEEPWQSDYVDKSRCRSSYKAHCTLYNDWMWSFIISLTIVSIQVLIMIILCWKMNYCCFAPIPTSLPVVVHQAHSNEL